MRALAGRELASACVFGGAHAAHTGTSDITGIRGPMLGIPDHLTISQAGGWPEHSLCMLTAAAIWPAMPALSTAAV